MKVGFIGLGAMGAPMASNLIAKGFEVTVYNRTRAKEMPLADLGASRAENPGRAADSAEVVVVIVSDTPDVESVLFGDDGVADSAPRGSVVVDMSTIDPKATEQFGGRLSERGIGFLDAPVSGGTEGAESGTLSIMVGGSPQDLAKAKPVLEAMGKPIHIGPTGSGQTTKAINQVIIAGSFIAIAEGMALGVKAGLDMSNVLSALGNGAARSWILEARAPRMLARDYPLGFKVSLHRKDLRIALAAADKAGINLEVAALAASREDSLIEDGYADSDMSALFESVLPRNQFR